MSNIRVEIDRCLSFTREDLREIEQIFGISLVVQVKAFASEAQSNGILIHQSSMVGVGAKGQLNLRTTYNLTAWKLALTGSPKGFAQTWLAWRFNAQPIRENTQLFLLSFEPRNGTKLIVFSPSSTFLLKLWFT